MYRERMSIVCEYRKVELKGQRHFELITELGLSSFVFRVTEGKIRINHCSYTPDGGTWLSPPNNGRRSHYDLSSSDNEVTLSFSIENSFGKKDRIMIVNPCFFRKTIFEYRQLETADHSNC